MFQINFGVPALHVKLIIEDCPGNGIKAIDFRRAAGLPEEPSNWITLPVIQWQSEADARTLPVNVNADLDAHSIRTKRYNEFYGEAVQSSFDDPAQASAAMIKAYLDNQTPETALALIRDMLAASDRARAAVVAEIERKRPEREAKAKREAEENAEREAEAKAKAERKAQGERILAEWVQANGSELVKARMAEGFEWVGLAEREWSLAIVEPLGERIEEMPDGCDSQTRGERTTPTLAEIEKLRAVRAQLGSNAIANLVWFEYSGADEYGENAVNVKRAEIEVTVTCPTGRTMDYYYEAK